MENKDIVQSYVSIVEGHNYTLYEEKILVAVVGMIQADLEGKQLNRKYEMQDGLFGEKRMKMPFSAISESNNYYHTKKAFRDLFKRVFITEDEEGATMCSMFSWAKIRKSELVAEFELNPPFYLALLDFSKGHKKFEFEKVIKMSSVYAIRLYKLLSGQKTKLTFKIETFRLLMLGEKGADKYKLIKDFRKRVIETAKNELDEKAPYSFVYELLKEDKGQPRRISHIEIIPVYQPEHRDENLEKKRLAQQSNASGWMIPAEIKNFLIHNFDFTSKELNAHTEKIKDLCEKMGIETMNFLSQKKEHILKNSDKISNPKGYIISVIQRESEGKIDFEKKSISNIFNNTTIGKKKK